MLAGPWTIKQTRPERFLAMFRSSSEEPDMCLGCQKSGTWANGPSLARVVGDILPPSEYAWRAGWPRTASSHTSRPAERDYGWTYGHRVVRTLFPRGPIQRYRQYHRPIDSPQRLGSNRSIAALEQDRSASEASDPDAGAESIPKYNGLPSLNVALFRYGAP